MNFPDIRVVTVAFDASDESVGEVEINAEGCGHYEALGMLLCAILKMAQPDLEFENDDDDEDDGDV
jgi:hypothetical protein